MIAEYGTENGFGWKVNEIVGAQIVSVPMAVALGRSETIRKSFIVVLASVFVLLIGLFNLLPMLMSSGGIVIRCNGERLAPAHRSPPADLMLASNRLN